MEKLNKSVAFQGPQGPVLLVIMDGVGIGKYAEGDMVRAAETPNLDWLKANTPNTALQAHGIAVGLLSNDDMGNSEVGHNAIGAGRVFPQGARLVNEAIESGKMFESETWKEQIANVKDNNTVLHFIGLLSDGNVHSHIRHLKKMLERAQEEDVQKVRIHILLDGRDVPPTSALEYVADLENLLEKLNGKENADYAIASGGGRMKITMDRYNADWSMVERGWQTHVRGEGRKFRSAREAIERLRSENPGILDQDLPSFVIERDEKSIGPINDADSVILFNFRGDRAMELTEAFEEEDFDKFERGPKPNLKYAGMMEYDGDRGIPKRFLVNPPSITKTLGEYLSSSGLRQLAVSETQKYGHVTYFFNGNRLGKFDPKTEDYVEIPSDKCPFEEKPRMKTKEITDLVLKAIESKKYDFMRLNFPNGDMVGHTGVPEAVKISVEAVDESLGRLMRGIEEAGGIMLVSADHGNADDMYNHDKKTGEIKRDENGKPLIKTAHSLNPVPAFVYDPSNSSKARLAELKNPGISNLAATIIRLLGYEPPDEYTPSIVELG